MLVCRNKFVVKEDFPDGMQKLAFDMGKEWRFGGSSIGSVFLDKILDFIWYLFKADSVHIHTQE